MKCGHIFTLSIKGFRLTVIPDKLALTLLKLTVVISIETDEFFSGDNKWHECIEILSLYQNMIASSYLGQALSENDTHGNSACPKLVQLSVKRVGDPIFSSPHTQIVEGS